MNDLIFAIDIDCHETRNTVKKAKPYRSIKWLLSQPGIKVVLSWYFELLWASTELPLNDRKPENGSYRRQKNSKETIINHKGTRMVKDGED